MNQNIRAFTTAILTTIAFLCECSADEKELNSQNFEKLLVTNDSCIIKIESGGEVYLDAAKILPLGDGLFLKTESGELLRIPALYSSQNGCFVESMTDSTVYPLIRCWNCKKLFNPNFFNKGKCTHCGAQN